MEPIGTIHGRFQPFHWGHLHMARLALERCQELTVGITNPDPSRRSQETADDHRHRPDANPFTFWERVRIIKRTLLEDEYPAERFNLVPFDVNHMENREWVHYMPPNACWYIRVKGEWGNEKQRRLQSHGLDVETLPFEEYTEINSTEIREAMASGEPWQDLIPPGGRELLAAMDPGERIRGLRDGSFGWDQL